MPGRRTRWDPSSFKSAGHSLFPPRNQVSAGGLVRDPAVHADVIRRVQEACMARGLVPQGHMPSPIKGANAGNTEFLAHFVFQATGAGVEEELEDGEPDEPAKS